MPKIYIYHCDTCDFTMPSGWGSNVYAVSDAGERIVCDHPGESYTMKMITGLSIMEARATGQAGTLTTCVCSNCLHQGEYDQARDARLCPVCSKGELQSNNELLGETCPKCGKGTFTRTWNGVMS